MKNIEGIRLPQQKRSAQTLRRIVAGVAELLREKTFDDISVGEIAARAGISVGGFYSRFESKETLLHWFDEELLEHRLGRLVEEFDRDRIRDADLKTIVRRYVTLGVELFSENQSLIREIALRSRADDVEVRHRAQRLNREIDGQVASAILERASEIRHPAPQVAVRFALLAVSAALREALLFGAHGLNLAQPDREELIEELTRLFLGYLDYQEPEREGER